jgi:quinoprotein glucose dehydrogenase
MYISTPFSRVIALDPVTGKEKWNYEPKIDLQAFYAEGLINRGVSNWLDPARTAHQPCRRRIYIGTIDARLISLDAASGHSCGGFRCRWTNQSEDHRREYPDRIQRRVRGYIAARGHRRSCDRGLCDR